MSTCAGIAFFAILTLFGAHISLGQNLSQNISGQIKLNVKRMPNDDIVIVNFAGEKKPDTSSLEKCAYELLQYSKTPLSFDEVKASFRTSKDIEKIFNDLAKKGSPWEIRYTTKIDFKTVSDSIKDGIPILVAFRNGKFWNEMESRMEERQECKTSSELKKFISKNENKKIRTNDDNHFPGIIYGVNDKIQEIIFVMKKRVYTLTTREMRSAVMNIRIPSLK